MIDELTENGEPVGLGGLVRDTLDVDERDEIEDEDVAFNEIRFTMYKVEK